MDGQKPIVAFLGPEGSYTHQATLTRFPATTHTLSPQRTIADVFHAVKGPGADSPSLGVVPFENSTNGSVVTTLDLLADPDVASQLRVCAEIYLPVHHSLCASAAAAAEVGSITKVYSHPQAWGQCTKFLAGPRWRGVERQDVSSTSRGAELVAAEGPGSRSAAISSAMAAELNGLVVVEDGIEDAEGNCTRFFVLEPRREGEEGAQLEAGEEGEEEEFKTLVTFTVSHTEAGALADCLAVFKRFGLNLTSINTRPSGESPWHYTFYVEFMGRKWPGKEGKRVEEALAELDRMARGWRWMGSWKNRLLSP